MVEEVQTVEIEEDERSNLNIQTFMNDMELLGDQVKSRELVKPSFFYGDASVTNYLLWLMLGELQILNNKLNDGGNE